MKTNESDCFRMFLKMIPIKLSELNNRTSGKSQTKLATMEALLIINGLLAIVGIYFLREFHRDFKVVAKSVDELKQELGKFVTKVKAELKTTERRLADLEKIEKRA